MSRPDVAVVGLGPAGRALAHRLLVRGARVLAIDPHPGRRWRPTYGGWAHQLPDWLDDGVVGAQSARTALVARGTHRLEGRYLVLDNDALQRRLSLEGADVRAELVDDDRMAGLAEVVVDCRGAARPRGRGRVPHQSAHGVMLPREAGEQVLGGHEAVLMDWRPHDGSADWGRRSPSFCYVVPLPDGRLLAEETCLAGVPPLAPAELADRLETRLGLRDVDPRQLAEGEVERVMIPMLAPPPVLANRFGAAGAELNPLTGYSVFASLAHADEAAARLLGSGRLPDHGSRWSAAALRALLRLSPQGVVELFDAFGRLPPMDQRAVLDGHPAATRLLPALARQWLLMPGRARGELILASARGARS